MGGSCYHAAKNESTVRWWFGALTPSPCMPWVVVIPCPERRMAHTKLGAASIPSDVGEPPGVCFVDGVSQDQRRERGNTVIL